MNGEAVFLWLLLVASVLFFVVSSFLLLRVMRLLQAINQRLYGFGMRHWAEIELGGRYEEFPDMPGDRYLDAASWHGAGNWMQRTSEQLHEIKLELDERLRTILLELKRLR